MHFPKCLYLILLIAIYTPSCLMSQTDDKVKDAFKAKYPNAENVSWETDSHDNEEAKFELDGKDYRADFSPSGVWIETERSIDYDDLPSVVRDVIEAEYDKDDVVEVEEVDHSSKGKFYDVEIDIKDGKIDVEVTPSGKIIGKN